MLISVYSDEILLVERQRDPPELCVSLAYAMEARNGYREMSIVSSSWERFCRDEAREAATRFVERTRKYKLRDPTSRSVHESLFASEFSACFVDEVLTQSREEHSTTATKEGGTSRFGKKKKVSSNSGTGGGGGGGGGGRSWWNIFRRAKTTRAAASGSPSGRGARRDPEERAAGRSLVVMEGTVNLLNMADPSQELLWQQARLVLASDRGNYQLEVFCPPKVRTSRQCVCVCVCIYKYGRRCALMSFYSLCDDK